MTILPKSFCFSILFLYLPALAAETTSLRICTDANAWYPFTYEENGESRGLHVDIVKLACQEVGLVCEFHSLPWKRCLSFVKSGHMDALVSASYNRERAEYMSYPIGAGSDQKSTWRITQAEYVVVTLADSDYEFNGDLTSLPEPVIVPLGYSIINELEEAGIKFIEYSKNIAMFNSLLREKKGSIVSITPIPEFVENVGMFKDKFKIHTKPITSKSYFIAVSKKSTLSNATKLALWKAVVAIRKDKQNFNLLLEQY